MKESNPKNPIAYLPHACEEVMELGMILIVVLEDNVRRILLPTIANRMEAPYVICGPKGSFKQFREQLANALGILPSRNVHQMWEDIYGKLSMPPRLAFLDEAHHLTKSCLLSLLDLHKRDEDRYGHRGIAFVLASGKQQLLKRVDAVDHGSYFSSHAMYYVSACKLTRPMIAKLQMLNDVFDAIASKPLPFRPK